MRLWCVLCALHITPAHDIIQYSNVCNVPQPKLGAAVDRHWLYPAPQALSCWARLQYLEAGSHCLTQQQQPFIPRHIMTWNTGCCTYKSNFVGCQEYLVAGILLQLCDLTIKFVSSIQTATQKRCCHSPCWGINKADFNPIMLVFFTSYRVSWVTSLCCSLKRIWWHQILFGPGVKQSASSRNLFSSWQAEGKMSSSVCSVHESREEG